MAQLPPEVKGLLTITKSPDPNPARINLQRHFQPLLLRQESGHYSMEQCHDAVRW
jgi:hypothetical protein